MLSLRASLAAAALSAPLSAAILTVGPNGTYAEIADAIAAAQSGDTILVEPGEYQPIVVHETLRILGDGTGPVVIKANFSNGVVVSGLGAADELVLSGIEVRANPVLSPIQASILLLGNAGTVLLHDVRVSHALSQTGVHAEQCERVVLLDCEILDAGPFGSSPPGAAVDAIDSTLWIAGSTITGHAAASGFAEPGDHAVSLAGGSLHVWRSTLRGGDGVPGKGFLVTPDGGDGVRAESATVVLYGGPVGDVVLGGDGAGGLFAPPGVGGAGVRLLAGSQARLQDALPIAGGLDASGLVQTPGVVTDGTSTAVLEPHVFATLAASVAQTSLGGAFDLAVAGNPGGVGVAFVSLQTGPTLAVPGVEGLGILDLGLFVQLPAFALGGSGAAAIPISVPPAPGLLGATFLFQAVELFGAQITITNPTLVAATG